MNSKFKALGAGFALVFAVVALAACGGGGGDSTAADTTAADTTSTQESNEEALTIGYLQTGPFEYYVRGAEGAEAASGDLGIDVKVFDSELTPEKEIANVEDAIQQGVDGLVLFSVGKASEKAALAKAKAADVPVAVLYGYDPSLEEEAVTFVQAPADLTGREAGEWIAENVEGGEVAVIQGQLGRGDAEAYTEGFEEGLSGNSELQVVATPAADWDRAKAQNAMQDILSANPELSAVFVQNDDMALGAAAALKAAGKQDQVTLVSQNGSPPGLEAVEAGTVAATVSWSPAEEAQMALARLVAFIREGTPADPKVCTTPTLLVTEANVAEAPPWVATPQSTEEGLSVACA
jgi:ribose transport system substrate-binding protein